MRRVRIPGMSGLYTHEQAAAIRGLPASKRCTSSYGYVKCLRPRHHEGACGEEGGVQWMRGKGHAPKVLIADPFDTFPSSRRVLGR